MAANHSEDNSLDIHPALRNPPNHGNNDRFSIDTFSRDESESRKYDPTVNETALSDVLPGQHRHQPTSNFSSTGDDLSRTITSESKQMSVNTTEIHPAMRHDQHHYSPISAPPVPNNLDQLPPSVRRRYHQYNKSDSNLHDNRGYDDFQNQQATPEIWHDAPDRELQTDNAQQPGYAAEYASRDAGLFDPRSQSTEYALANVGPPPDSHHIGTTNGSSSRWGRLRGRSKGSRQVDDDFLGDDEPPPIPTSQPHQSGHEPKSRRSRPWSRSGGHSRRASMHQQNDSSLTQSNNDQPLQPRHTTDTTRPPSSRRGVSPWQKLTSRSRGASFDHREHPQTVNSTTIIPPVQTGERREFDAPSSAPNPSKRGVSPWRRLRARSRGRSIDNTNAEQLPAEPVADQERLSGRHANENEAAPTSWRGAASWRSQPALAGAAAAKRENASSARDEGSSVPPDSQDHLKNGSISSMKRGPSPWRKLRARSRGASMDQSRPPASMEVPAPALEASEIKALENHGPENASTKQGTSPWKRIRDQSRGAQQRSSVDVPTSTKDKRRSFDIFGATFRQSRSRSNNQESNQIGLVDELGQKQQQPHQDQSLISPSTEAELVRQREGHTYGVASTSSVQQRGDSRPYAAVAGDKQKSHQIDSGTWSRPASGIRAMEQSYNSGLDGEPTAGLSRNRQEQTRPPLTGSGGRYSNSQSFNANHSQTGHGYATNTYDSSRSDPRSHAPQTQQNDNYYVAENHPAETYHTTAPNTSTQIEQPYSSNNETDSSNIKRPRRTSTNRALDPSDMVMAPEVYTNASQDTSVRPASKKRGSWFSNIFTSSDTDSNNIAPRRLQKADKRKSFTRSDGDNVTNSDTEGASLWAAQAQASILNVGHSGSRPQSWVIDRRDSPIQDIPPVPQIRNRDLELNHPDRDHHIQYLQKQDIFKTRRRSYLGETHPLAHHNYGSSASNTKEQDNYSLPPVPPLPAEPPLTTNTSKNNVSPFAKISQRLNPYQSPSAKDATNYTLDSTNTPVGPSQSSWDRFERQQVSQSNQHLPAPPSKQQEQSVHLPISQEGQNIQPIPTYKNKTPTSSTLSSEPTTRPKSFSIPRKALTSRQHQSDVPISPAFEQPLPQGTSIPEAPSTIPRYQPATPPNKPPTQKRTSYLTRPLSSASNSSTSNSNDDSDGPPAPYIPYLSTLSNAHARTPSSPTFHDAVPYLSPSVTGPVREGPWDPSTLGSDVGGVVGKYEGSLAMREPLDFGGVGVYHGSGSRVADEETRAGAQEVG